MTSSQNSNITRYEVIFSYISVTLSHHDHVNINTAQFKTLASDIQVIVGNHDCR